MGWATAFSRMGALTGSDQPLRCQRGWFFALWTLLSRLLNFRFRLSSF